MEKRGGRELGEMAVAHLAARHAALARRRIERLVDPAQEGAVVLEHRRRSGAGPAEIEVRRVDLGGERAGVEASLGGEDREAAHAAGAHAVVLGLAVAIERLLGAAAGVEKDLVALEQPPWVRRRPGLELLPSRPRGRGSASRPWKIE